MIPGISSIALEEDASPSALLIKSFPEGLKRQLKSLAAMEGKHLKDYVIEVLNEHIGNIPETSSPKG